MDPQEAVLSESACVTGKCLILNACVACVLRFNRGAYMLFKILQHLLRRAGDIAGDVLLHRDLEDHAAVAAFIRDHKLHDVSVFFEGAHGKKM